MTAWRWTTRMLLDPDVASRRLIARLRRWRPAAVHRHSLVDDCARRQWRKDGA